MHSLFRFVLAKERLGHPFSLNHKGSETHNTWLGTVLTLAINVLVLIILAEKTIDLFLMRDPAVTITS